MAAVAGLGGLAPRPAGGGGAQGDRRPERRPEPHRSVTTNHCTSRRSVLGRWAGPARFFASQLGLPPTSETNSWRNYLPRFRVRRGGRTLVDSAAEARA